MSAVDDIAEILGYSSSSSFWQTDEGDDPSTAHLFRAAQRAGIRGCYLFRTSPDATPNPTGRPAVHVAEAKTRDQARDIHRSLWNLGVAPFLIIVLPDEVRVYTGFVFDPRNDEAGLITGVVLGATDIQTALAAFHATEIDSGRIWKSFAQLLDIERRVDRHLLASLKKLSHELVTNHKLKPAIAHALIGKYVYIRYLRDRLILSDAWLRQNKIAADEVFGPTATLAGLRRLVEALETRFNGSVFPVDLREGAGLDDNVVSYVSAVFRHGMPDHPEQLPLDIEFYDFSYIPVELLSEIYEQFLHEKGEGRAVGAYYTPEPLADYLVSELHEYHPLRLGMRILDPCCGSGIFLVLVYRRLIEIKQAENPGVALTPDELREILSQSIFGVERNPEACYVAEFGLLLTLLSYVQPPELHQNTDFRFPTLHNVQIFESDFFEANSSFELKAFRFDWIIGNPPWGELKPVRQDVPDFDRPLRFWLASRDSNARPVARDRKHEAFTWRVTDFLAESGWVGLIIQATSLFIDQGKGYRAAFFAAHEVARISNFSNLAYILFQGRAEAPAATLIYRPKPPSGGASSEIVHYGPLVANQLATRHSGRRKQKAWTITIYGSEIKTVGSDEAATGEAAIWKRALWGAYHDDRILKRLKRLMPSSIGCLVERDVLRLQLGLQLRPASAPDAPLNERSVYEPLLAELPLLNKSKLRASGNCFLVPDSVLESIPEHRRYIRVRNGKAGLQVARAPHVFLTPTFAAFGERDFVLEHPQVGIAADEPHSDLLRAISVLFSSSLIRYCLFFRNSVWGIDRTRLDHHAVRDVPLPDMSLGQITELAAFHRWLAARDGRASQPKSSSTLWADADPAGGDHSVSSLEESEWDMPAGDLQQQLDDVVEQVLGIPDAITFIVRDMMGIRLQLNKGKTNVPATARPDEAQLRKYGELLAMQLDRFAGIRHQITIELSRDVGGVIVEAMSSDDSEHSVRIGGRTGPGIERLWQTLYQQQSQWVYVQRSLRLFDGLRVFLYKPTRVLDWTRTEALRDADDIIAEVLARGMHSG